MNYTDDAKLQILISALQERYIAIHTIRSRVEKVSLWALGLMLAVSGWLIQSSIRFSNEEKILFVIGIISAFLVLRYIYFADLERGFKKQKQVASRLEELLGLYDPEFFETSKSQSTYPEEWLMANEQQKFGKFFRSTYFLLYTGTLILLLAVLIVAPAVSRPSISF